MLLCWVSVSNSSWNNILVLQLAVGPRPSAWKSHHGLDPARPWGGRRAKIRPLVSDFLKIRKMKRFWACNDAMLQCCNIAMLADSFRSIMAWHSGPAMLQYCNVAMLQCWLTVLNSSLHDILGLQCCIVVMQQCCNVGLQFFNSSWHGILGLQCCKVAMLQCCNVGWQF